MAHRVLFCAWHLSPLYLHIFKETQNSVKKYCKIPNINIRKKYVKYILRGLNEYIWMDVNNLWTF